MNIGNLLTDCTPPASGERFDPLLKLRHLVVERIVSSAAPESTEYVQPQDEWVLLVSGTAMLEVAGEARALVAGDHLFLPSGTPHRVLRTSEGALWVAVHLHPDPAPAVAAPVGDGDANAVRIFEHLSIRRATPADADEIAALLLALSGPFYLSPSREGAEPFLASIDADAQRGYLGSPRYAYHVARAGAQLAGIVALRDNAHLFHLFVAAPFQGQGLSRRLWEMVRAEALQRGNRGVFTVNASLNAVLVYRAFGFVADGEVQRMHGIAFQPMRLTLPGACA